MAKISKHASEEAPPSAARVRLLRQPLLRWYAQNKRDLPWRHTRDPYAIWVSEVMLQQTQVETVRKYFERFMAQFPTVLALADASQEDVLRAWSGLGYYRRARMMYASAQVIRDVYGGTFPRHADQIRGLPGVGAYTAAALLSIAFNTPAAAVDGNVTRVLSRLLLLQQCGPPQARKVGAWALALGQCERPADVTQALMELGATVCLPAGARCEQCPWRNVCKAKKRGMTDRIPPPRKRAERKPLHLALGLVVDGSHLYLMPTHGEGLFGGLWQLPSSGEVVGRASSSSTQMRRALVTAQPDLRVHRLLARTARTLTHRDLVLWTFAASWKGPQPEAARRVLWSELEDAPLSSAVRAALRDATRARGGETS
jgi:A/G-specific adenine glycosylase